MNSWNKSKVFSSDYIVVLDSSDVRYLAQLACENAVHPVKKVEANNAHRKKPLFICEYSVKGECIHGDTCEYSHHPSRGLSPLSNKFADPDSVMEKWRNDYHWQLWALAYAKASSPEFHCASDDPHKDLRKLVGEMHFAARASITKAANRERQLLAQSRAMIEQKVLDDFGKKTTLRLAIQKDLDCLSELDVPLTETVRGWKKDVDGLSFQILADLTPNELIAEMGPAYSESVNFIALVFSFLWETRKLTKLKKCGTVEKKKATNFQKQLHNAQQGVSTAIEKLEKWNKTENATVVLDLLCTLITGPSSAGDKNGSSSCSKCSIHAATFVQTNPAPAPGPELLIVPMLAPVGETYAAQPIDSSTLLLRQTLGLLTATKAHRSSQMPHAQSPPIVAPNTPVPLANGLPRLPQVTIAEAVATPSTATRMSPQADCEQLLLENMSTRSDIPPFQVPAAVVVPPMFNASDVSNELFDVAAPISPSSRGSPMISTTSAPTASFLSVEDWLANGVVSSCVSSLATSFRGLGYYNTEIIYDVSWDTLSGDLKGKNIPDAHLRQVKRAFDMGLQQHFQQNNTRFSPAPTLVSESSSPTLLTAPPLVLETLISTQASSFETRTFVELESLAVRSSAAPAALSPGVHKLPLFDELAHFHQERLCLDQLLVHVALPVILRYLEVTWNAFMDGDSQSVCNGCKAKHYFNQIASKCVLCVARAQEHSLMITFAKNTSVQARGAEVLRFDVGMICRAFDYLLSCNVRKDNDKIGEIVSGARNVQAHLMSGDHKELSSEADHLVQLVHSLMKDLNYSAKEVHNVHTTIEQCRSTKTYLQLEQFHFEDLSLRVSEMQFKRFDVYNLSALVSARFERTLQIAKVLSRKTVCKYLFLPPLYGGPSQTSASQNKFGFLDTIAWETVFDFSGVEGGFLPKCATNMKTDYIFAFKPMPESLISHMRQELAAIICNDGVERACFFVTFPAQSTTSHLLLNVRENYLSKLRALLELQTSPCCKFYVLSESYSNEQNSVDASDTSIDVVLSKLNSPLGPDVSPPVAKLSLFDQTRRCSFELLKAELSKANGGKTLLIPSGVLGAHRYPLSSNVWDEFLTFAEGEILDIGCGSYAPDRKTGESCTDVKRTKDLHSYLDGAPAAWPLFADGSLKRRSQFNVIRDALDDNNKQSVILRHASKSGGSTLARHVLYSLHERFICITVRSFKSTEDIDKAVAVLKRIHVEVGNEIIVLIDLVGPEFSESFRNDVRQHMRKISTFCRYIECSSHAQPSFTQKILSSDGDTLQIELQPMSAAEAVDLMDQYPAWFPDRGNELSRCIEQCLDQEAFSLPAEYLSNGLFESGLVWAAVAEKEETCGWESKLLKFACENPEDLIQGGFWPLEVYELSSHDTSHYGISEKYKLSKLPLIHCGLLAANTKYAARARKAVQTIVEYLYASNPCEFKFLRFLVFASLFAPSIRFSTGFYKLFDPANRPLSQSFMEMVRCETMNDAESTVVLSIPIPKMAAIIAEHEHMFKTNKRDEFKKVEVAPMDAEDLPIVGHYAKEVLIPLIIQCASHNKFAKLRQHLLFALNYSFCRFNVWHWVLRNQRTERDKSYAFIVEFLKKSHSVAFAAEVFKEVAIAAIPLVTTQTKHNVGLLTHACRLLERYAKQLDEQKRVEWFSKARNVLAKITNNFSNDPVVLLRRASIAKKEMACLIKTHSKSPTLLPVVMLTELFEESLFQFQAATEQSKNTWSHPLVGMVQSTVSMISALQAKFKCKGSIEICRAKLAECNEMGAKRLLHFVTLDEIKKMYNLLTGSRLASKYIVNDTDVERQQKYLTECLNNLAEICGQTTDLQKAQQLLHTCTNHGVYTVRDMEAETLCWCLAVIGKDMSSMLEKPEVPFAERNDTEAIAADAADWAVKAEMENIVELSTAIAARVYSLSTTAEPRFYEDFRMPQICQYQCSKLWAKTSTDALKCGLQAGTAMPAVLSVLYCPDDALSRWLSYPATSAHGLCRHVANVMMRIYDKLFDPTKTHLESADTLDTALGKLLTSSTRYRNVSTTRYFIAEQCAIEGMPLTAFIAVDCNPELLRARNNRSKHDHYVRAFRTQQNVRLFRGEVLPPPSRAEGALREDRCAGDDTSSSLVPLGSQMYGLHNPVHPRMVSCPKLGLVIRFYNASNLDGSAEFSEGQEVEYAVGIKDNGLFAHGLSCVVV